MKEKYHTNLVYLNVSEVKNINAPTEEFITGCLIKKRDKFINLSKNNIKGKINEGNLEINYIGKAQKQADIEQKALSPKKNKIENCHIF